MSTVNGYTHLGPRHDSRYRQFFVNGTRIRAETLYRETVGIEARTAEQVAEDFGVPLEAVREAIRYCAKRTSPTFGSAGSTSRPLRLQITNPPRIRGRAAFTYTGSWSESLRRSDRAASLVQYISIMYLPPCAGLPITRWFTGSTTKSRRSSGIWPTSTGQSSGSAATSSGHCRS